MDGFELTRDMMARAKTYMPLADKQVLANLIAHKCVHPMKRVKWDGAHISDIEEIEGYDDPTALPDLVEEDICMKFCLLQNVLLNYYFDEKTPEATDGYELYDQYASGHLMNQLERYKADREFKNKAFDLTEDFREFRKMVDTIIYNYKMNVNDPLKRFDAMLTLFASPENLQALLTELQNASGELKEKVLDAEDGQKSEQSGKILNPIPEA